MESQDVVVLYYVRNRRTHGVIVMKKSEYDVQYAREHLRRVPLDLTHDDYDIVTKAAAASGESVNAYLKHAVALRMAQDYESQSDSDWVAELIEHVPAAPSNRQTISNMFYRITSEGDNQ